MNDKGNSADIILNKANNVEDLLDKVDSLERKLGDIETLLAKNLDTRALHNIMQQLNPPKPCLEPLEEDQPGLKKFLHKLSAGASINVVRRKTKTLKSLTSPRKWFIEKDSKQENVNRKNCPCDSNSSNESICSVEELEISDKSSQSIQKFSMIAAPAVVPDKCGDEPRKNIFNDNSSASLLSHISKSETDILKVKMINFNTNRNIDAHLNPVSSSKAGTKTILEKPMVKTEKTMVKANLLKQANCDCKGQEQNTMFKQAEIANSQNLLREWFWKRCGHKIASPNENKKDKNKTNAFLRLFGRSIREASQKCHQVDVKDEGKLSLYREVLQGLKFSDRAWNKLINELKDFLGFISAIRQGEEGNKDAKERPEKTNTEREDVKRFMLQFVNVYFDNLTQDTDGSIPVDGTVLNSQ